MDELQADAAIGGGMQLTANADLISVIPGGKPWTVEVLSQEDGQPITNRVEAGIPPFDAVVELRALRDGPLGNIVFHDGAGQERGRVMGWPGRFAVKGQIAELHVAWPPD